MISVEKLNVKYGNNIALKDITFSIKEGDYLCIVGCNGSGKSTLIKTILGLIKKTSGTISLTIDKNKIGYLPQTTKTQSTFPASVYEVVLSGCNKKLFYSNEDKKLVERNLKKLKIYNLKDRSYKNLSGGQRQRVLLARALCSTSKVIFMDEPTAGLDPKTIGEFYELINVLNKEDKLTVITTSHDIDEITKYANKVLELEQVVTFFGSTKEYFKKNKHTHEYEVK